MVFNVKHLCTVYSVSIVHKATKVTLLLCAFVCVQVKFCVILITLGDKKI